MKKPPFLDAPGRWTKAARVDQTSVQYANAFEGHVEVSRAGDWQSRLVFWLSLVTAVCSFAILIHP